MRYLLESEEHLGELASHPSGPTYTRDALHVQDAWGCLPGKQKSNENGISTYNSNSPRQEGAGQLRRAESSLEEKRSLGYNVLRHKTAIQKNANITECSHR